MVFPDVGGGGQEETLRITIILDTQDVLKKAAASKEAIEEIKGTLRTLKAQSSLTFKEIGEGMKDAFTAVPGGMTKPQYGKQVTEAIRQIAEEEKKAAKDTQDVAKQGIEIEKKRAAAAVEASRAATQAKLKETQQQTMLNKELEKPQKTGILGFLGNLGTVGQFVFGSVLGLTAVTALRNIVRFLTEAAQAAYEFAKAVFQLEIGVRALQRAGVDITIKQMYEQLRNLKKEFGIFAFTDLVKGASQFVNLNRDMGFTRDELFNLQKAVATLSVVNGRTIDEVQKTVALAVSSGYTEGLQRLGVSINRVTIAQEAANLGWRNGYTALTEVQRAQATYNLIIRKTAIYQDDLLKYQNEAPGEIDRLSAAWKDLKKELGSSLLPILGAFAGLLADVLSLLESGDEKVKNFNKSMMMMLNVINPLINPLKFMSFLLTGMDNAFTKLGETIKNKGSFGIKEFVQAWKDAFNEIAGVQGEGGILGDVIQTDEAKTAAELAKITTAVSNSIDDIEDAIGDGAKRRIELDENLQRDLEQMQRESLRRREELERDYQRKIEDINRDAARDVDAANHQYATDLEDLNRDTAKKEEELKNKQRQKELDDEKKFQEKMRKLRADFLFDLEEAVRSRDAVQIRKLQRRFEFERSELLIQREQEKEERAKSIAQEIADLRRQAEEKRRELAIQFAQKLEDIARQRQQELQDAAVKHVQDLEDLRRQEEEKRKERLIAYRQEIDDLTRQQNDRLKKVAEALAQEVALTGRGAQAVYDTLKAYFGPGGAIDLLFQYYIQAVNNVAASTNTALSGIDTANPNNPTGNAGGYAYGGSFIADRPTTARFGERAGIPELVTAIPLGRNNYSAAGSMMSNAWNGSLSVRILLDSGLQGEIVDRALGEFDNLLASIERAR